MNYGLYLSASGVLTNMYRQDVFANNLANVETVGYKPDVPDIRQREPAAVETQAAGDVSRKLLDQLGGGVLAAPQRIDFTPGPLKPTGNPLDLALESPDTFFAIAAGKNASANDSGIRLTRDGRFTRDAQGYLAMATSGQRVLDDHDNPIEVNGGDVHIDPAGHVIRDGQIAAQIQVTRVSDNRLLKKQGQNLFRWDGKKDIRTAADSSSVKPGFVESSGVDPIRAMMNVMEATQAASDSANMIHYQDMLMDRAINTLGRVA